MTTLQKKSREIIRDSLLVGIASDETRHKLLATADISLEDAIKICRAEEAACQTQTVMEQTQCDKQVNALRKSQYKKDLSTRNRSATAVGRAATPNVLKPMSKVTCRGCGFPHPLDVRCPAEGRTCHQCGKVGHFKKVCTTNVSESYTRKPRVGRISLQRVELLEDEKIVLQTTVGRRTTPTFLSWLPDTGSDVNAIGPRQLEQLCIKPDELDNDPSVVTIANGQSLTNLGKLTVKLESEDGRSCCTVMHVYEGISTPLLSRSTLKELGILPQQWPRKCASVGQVSTRNISHSTNANEDAKQKLLCEFSDVFNSTRLPPMHSEPMMIRLKADARPFRVNAPRSIPHAYRDQVKQQIDEMVEKSIIEPVTEPSEWCHPIVVVPKKGSNEKRLVVDLTKLNKQVLRPVHPGRTIRDTISNIDEAQYFTTLDARHGYWQVPLKEECRHLTTFITPWGRFRYMRNPQGFIAAGDEFNQRMDVAFTNIGNFGKVVDDCLLHDKKFDTHLERTRKVLKQAREHGITFSAKKFEFAKSEVYFCGYVIGQNGWRIDDDKVKAIREFRTPKNRTDLRSFLGLANQFTEFTPRLAACAQPLRDLLKKTTEFVWLTDHEQAMSDVKNTLLETPALSYFRFGCPLRIEADASRTNGLGFALLQFQEGSWRLIQCGSRFISDTEARYAMIELECLAIVWATRKCNAFLAGTEFTIITDHKPLVPILNQYTLDKIENPRLLRLVMKLQAHQFTAEWKKGKDHFLADALSRAPIDQPSTGDHLGEIDDDDSDDDTTVPTIARISTIEDGANDGVDIQTEILRKAASNDEEYQTVLQMIREGFPEERSAVPAAAKPYWNVRQHLTVENGIALKGPCIIVPQQLRHEALQSIHSAHQGIERTKRRARQTIYWPGITNDIETLVRSCRKCSEYQASLPKEHMVSEPTPGLPFQTVSVDLFTCQGRQYLVYADIKSGWPCVENLGHSTTSVDVIKPIRRWFAEVGVPKKMKTDGGPQFTSKRFHDFCTKWQVQHQRSTPHYPQANGHAESAVKTVKKLILKTTTNGELNTDEFQRALLEWRNTPRADGRSPAQILYGRPMTSFVFANHRTFSPQYQRDAKEADRAARKVQADAQSHYNQSAHHLGPFRIGQLVDVQDHRTGKWSATGTIVAIGKNRDYFVKFPSGRVYWRNRRFLRTHYPSIPAHVKVPPAIRTEVSVTSSPIRQGVPLRRSSRVRRPVTRLNIDSFSGKSYD